MTDQATDPRADPDEIRRAALREAAAIARKFNGQFGFAAWHVPEVIAKEIEQGTYEDGSSADLQAK